jgi:hypothetical protein
LDVACLKLAHLAVYYSVGENSNCYAYRQLLRKNKIMSMTTRKRFKDNIREFSRIRDY